MPSTAPPVDLTPPGQDLRAQTGAYRESRAAGDNPAMESFFSLLQKNVLDRRRWVTREELRIAIVTWIEKTYHRRRRQASLGRLTPVEFKIVMTTPAPPLPDVTRPSTTSN